jgi:hypothetical protein
MNQLLGFQRIFMLNSWTHGSQHRVSVCFVQSRVACRMSLVEE